MWRALLVFVAAILAVGLYVLFTAGPPASAAAPSQPPASSFGFALAAGAVALAATLMVTRPRFRSRR